MSILLGALVVVGAPVAADLVEAWRQDSLWPPEEQQLPDGRARSTPPSVFEEADALLAHWVEKLHCQQDPLFRAHDLLQRFLLTAPCGAGEWPPLVCAALLLALKVEERVASLQDLMALAKDHPPLRSLEPLSEQAVCQWERRMVRALDWRVAEPTAHQWALAVLLGAKQQSPEVLWQAQDHLHQLFKAGGAAAQFSPAACGEAAALLACPEAERPAVWALCGSGREQLAALMQLLETSRSTALRARAPPAEKEPPQVQETNESLGEGSFGAVRQVLVNGRPAAMKRIVGPPGRPDLPYSAVVEAGTLRLLGHGCPCIAGLQSVLLLPSGVDLLLELAQGSMRHWMEATPSRGPGAVAQAMQQVMQGLAWAHARGVVHGDLKPANVLWYGGTRFRLADFGSAAKDPLHDSREWAPETTLQFMAPEALLQYPHCCEAVDLWAAGCIMGEALCPAPMPALFNFPTDGLSRPRAYLVYLKGLLDTFGLPARGDVPADLWPRLDRLLRNKKAPLVVREEPWGLQDRLLTEGDLHWEELTPPCRELLSALLTLNPDRRISAKAALEGAFLGGVTQEERKPLLMHQPQTHRALKNARRNS